MESAQKDLPAEEDDAVSIMTFPEKYKKFRKPISLIIKLMWKS